MIYTIIYLYDYYLICLFIFLDELTRGIHIANDSEGDPL